MKRLVSMLVAVAVLAAVGSTNAGEMTPKEAMAKMQSCVACAPMSKYPDLMPNIRYDIFETKAGFVATFMIANEKMMETFNKCNKECDVARQEAMKMTDAELKGKLCPFCVGMRKVMSRKDVTFEKFSGSMGEVMMAGSTSKEGTAALHNYAKMARETSALLDQAAMEMMKEMEMEAEHPTGKS